VIDGIKSPASEAIVAPGPVFSPDSQHVAYAGGTGGEVWLMVDGQKSDPYDYFQGFHFESSNLIRAIAMRYDEFFNKEFLRVEIEILKK